MNSQGVGLSQEDADLAAIVVPSYARFGGCALLAAGVLTLFFFLQTVLIARSEPIVMLALVIQFVLGTGSSFLGLQLARGNGRAAVLGTGFAAATFVLGSAWFVYALVAHLGVSVLALFLPPMAAPAVIFCAVSIDWGKRAHLARERLRAQGLDSGL